MIKKVTHAFTNHPSVITEGISDMIQAGKSDDDSKPADVEEDVGEIDKQRGDIESANAFQAIAVSRSGFTGAEEKISKTRDMITQSRGSMVRPDSLDCASTLRVQVSAIL